MTIMAGDSHGQTDSQTAAAATQVHLRTSWAPGLPDAGQAARGEREGAGDADGQTREVVQERRGEDQGEGQPDLGEDEDVIASYVVVPPQGPDWSWSGSQPFEATRRHVYLSTSCYHGDHLYCQTGVRGDGCAKRPAQCKFCDARCICDCHH